MSRATSHTIITVLLGSTFAITLGLMGITLENWRFWLLLGMFLLYGIARYLVGHRDGMKKLLDAQQACQDTRRYYHTDRELPS